MGIQALGPASSLDLRCVNLLIPHTFCLNTWASSSPRFPKSPLLVDIDFVSSLHKVNKIRVVHSLPPPLPAPSLAVPLPQAVKCPSDRDQSSSLGKKLNFWCLRVRVDPAPFSHRIKVLSLSYSNSESSSNKKKVIQAWTNESLRWPNKDETIVRRAAYCQLMDMLSPSYTVLKKGKSKLSRVMHITRILKHNKQVLREQMLTK